MAQIPPALQVLHGDDLGAVTAAELENLLGAEENQDLEFKPAVGEAKGERREFAMDVTALANGSGTIVE